MANLPTPRNDTDAYLAAIHSELVGLRLDLATDSAERRQAARQTLADQARVTLSPAVADAVRQAAPVPAVVHPVAIDQVVELREPLVNLPPLSDEAGEAMARVLQEPGRPAKPKPPAKPKAGT